VTSETTFGILLVVFLLGLAGLYVWRALPALRGQGAPGSPDRRYYRNQARRRLASAVLMVLCAGLIVGWFFLEDDLKESAQLSVLYWVAVLLLVLAILLLAAFDFRAIAHYGLRNHRQLEAARRAMLENQAARLRSRRNGFS
jgi:fatty acid desaturase